jgi:hypothetical protein
MKESNPVIGGGLALVAALLGALIKLTVVGTVLAFLLGSFFPQEIGWEAKNAWSKCEGAVAGSIAWPSDAGEACGAMRMCQNEAALNPQQRAALDLAIRRSAVCGAP